MLYLEKIRPIFFIAVGCLSIALGLLVIQADITAIASSYPDIIYGPLFALGGALITYGLRPTRQKFIREEAAKLIRSGRVYNKILGADIDILSAISLVERDIDAGISRLNDYYDSRTSSDLFHNERLLLLVTTGDLCHARTQLMALRHLVEFKDEDDIREVGHLGEFQKYREFLEATLRDINEAFNRRTEVYHTLNNLDKFEEVLDLFRVMSSDIAKAHITLALLLMYPQREEYIHRKLLIISEFLNVALERSIAIARQYDSNIEEMLSKIASDSEIRARANSVYSYLQSSYTYSGEFLPPTYGVMINDVLNAQEKLGKVTDKVGIVSL